jgi:hypothetical protein
MRPVAIVGPNTFTWTRESTDYREADLYDHFHEEEVDWKVRTTVVRYVRQPVDEQACQSIHEHIVYRLGISLL